MSGRNDPPDERPGRDAGDLLDEDGRVNTGKIKSITNNPSFASSITAARCQTFRERAREGETPTDLAEEFGHHKSTIYQHLRDECHHHSGDIPGLEKGWYETSRDPETAVGANAYLSARTCGQIRRELLSGTSVSAVAERLDVSGKSVSRHGKGDCGHGHTNPAPVAFGWHVPAGAVDE